jgi:hypothetical protein
LVVARQYFDSDSAYITILSVKRQDDSASQDIRECYLHGDGCRRAAEAAATEMKKCDF